MKCRECIFLRAMKETGKTQFFCAHPNQKHIKRYCEENNLQRPVGFIEYAVKPLVLTMGI
jgi:hypothetical protein